MKTILVEKCGKWEAGDISCWSSTTWYWNSLTEKHTACTCLGYRYLLRSQREHKQQRQYSSNSLFSIFWVKSHLFNYSNRSCNKYFLPVSKSLLGWSSQCIFMKIYFRIQSLIQLAYEQAIIKSYTWSLSNNNNWNSLFFFISGQRLWYFLLSY